MQAAVADGQGAFAAELDVRICMFSRIMPGHSPGGMQDHVQALSAGLVRCGHQVVVLTSGRVDGVEQQVDDGVETHFLPGTAAGRYSSTYWSAGALKFEELHTSEPFHVLHSQSVGAYGVYRRGLNRILHVPLVTSLHGTHLDVLTTSLHTDLQLTDLKGSTRFGALALSLAFRYLCRDLWFIRGSDRVIATSDADVWKYQTLYRLPESKIRKVYNGVDTDLFSPRPDDPSVSRLRDELAISANSKVILALARLVKDKGVQNAISVLPRVRQSVPAVLIVVGDGDYRPALERLAQSAGVAAQVRFVGALPLPECARYFNLCDVFIDPTLRTDGYDLTIAEAMACAKPVVVSDVGANSTLVDKSGTIDGVLIPRGDNDALLREVLQVLNDPALAQSMGARARKKITERFSIPAMVSGMLRVYEELVNSR